MSDNGPCYNSKEWQQFARQYGFHHVTSSPQYAQANGKAEKRVHIVRQLLKKAADSKLDLYLALLSYRMAPLECGFPSRAVNESQVAHSSTLLYRHQGECGGTDKTRGYEMETMRYDKPTKTLRPLARDDVVRIQDQDAWDRKATVLQEVGPRSYEVRTEEGHVLRRNRHHLLRTEESFKEPECEDEDGHASVSRGGTVPDLGPIP